MLSTLSLVLALTPLAFAVPTNDGREPTIDAFAGTFSCPASYEPFRASSSLLIPTATASQVWEEMGDFCEVDWQGFELISSSGKCNSHRSLRTYRASDVELTERLDLIQIPTETAGSTFLSTIFTQFGIARPHLQSQVYAHGYTTLNRPTLAGADVVRMKSLVKVAETAEGAMVSWDVVGCSDYPEHLEDKLEEVHQGLLWSVEGRLRDGQGGARREHGQGLKEESTMDILEEVMASAIY